MHFLDYVLYEPESSDCESYYLNWLDSSYSRTGPYGEPLQYHQQELHDESKFSVHEEAEDGLFTGSWHSNHEGNDQIQLPCRGRSDWLDEYESYYFAGGWGEDAVLQDYNNTLYEPYKDSLKKADHAFADRDEDGDYQSFNEGVKQVVSDNQWPSLDFGLAVGMNEFCQDHSWKDPQPVYDDWWSETELWESIFGHWPCLAHPERESPAVPTHY